ncbi:response regulator [Arcicella rigui]|uniref:Response regulator n=1 Tax=Arcicella rigui TaxID=797020 RepID=A0ABU5Q683_9BACT|nr:response regulator [Arcicella rigui]MEA5138361.1 response regulator [Arcicella rigui]
MMNNFMTLIVDDEHLNRLLMKKFLATGGIPYAEATDGQEAIDWIKGSTEKQIIVLLDLNMPVMDGYEFLEYLSYHQDEFSDKKILIVIVSASEYTVFRQNAPNAEIVQYISKPVSKDVLIDVVWQAAENLQTVF